MKFLRAWWLQILGVVVVLGFLGWLALAGSGRVGVHVSASATPSPTLSAQQEIEQTVKDFVVAYDLSAKTEDPSGAQAFCKPQSAAEGEAAYNVYWAKRYGEAFVVDQSTWDPNSWSIDDVGVKATVTANLTETGHWATAPALVQKEAEKTVRYQWTSSLSLLGGKWELTDFQETTV